MENDHPVQMVYNAMGQRIAMEDITGESIYTYDSLGRLKTAANGSGKVVEYVYDEANNLAAIRYPDGGEVSYEYDKNDNITKLTDRDGRDTTYEYDPLNRLTKVVRADGSESVYTYNARNQVLEAENTCVCGFLISDYKYTYDDAGFVTKRPQRNACSPRIRTMDIREEAGTSAPMRKRIPGTARTPGITSGSSRTHGRTRTRSGRPR